MSDQSTRIELTTLADDLAVFHAGTEVHRFTGLQPGEHHEIHGEVFSTLERPSGELRCRIATVNDVHFGEFECGRIDDRTDGPIMRPEPGEPPYPETMNRAAAAEIASIDPTVVIVKGDLTFDGTDEEFAAFEACYSDRFGQRLRVVRGNHDSYRGQQRYTGYQWIELLGVNVALLDTTRDGKTTGFIDSRQIDWLDAYAAQSTSPVLVMGHHQQWTDGNRDPGYFGINPDDSDALTDVIERRKAIVAYTCGHTHRHRRRWLRCGVPTIEVGCVKDFPGTWAEYRVFDGGILQVVHRISSVEALSWSERCRHLYRDFGIDYQSYALGTMEDRCFPITFR